MDPLRHARRVAVTVIGATILLVGVALLVLPGPAFVVIPIGLAILSTEFVWAAKLLKHVKENAEFAAQTMMRPSNRTAGVSFWSRLKLWLTTKPVVSEPPVK